MTRTGPLSIHQNSLPDQKAAEAAMAKAGVKGPRQCLCEEMGDTPMIDPDPETGELRCLRCAREWRP